MRRIVSVIVIFALSISLCSEAFAWTELLAENQKYKKFTYSIYSAANGCVVDKYVELDSYKGKASNLKLPSSIKIDGRLMRVAAPPSQYKYPKKIKKITLESSFSRVYRGQYAGLPNLKAFYFKNPSSRDFVKKGILFHDFMGGIWLEVYPRGKKEKSYKLPKNVSVIGPYAFANCKNLKSITLSENLIEINDYAFYGCKSLKKITIPKWVNYIGAGAFKKCQANVIMPPYMEKVQDQSGEGYHYELFVDSRPKEDLNAAIEHIPYRDIREIQPDAKTLEMTVDSKHSLVTHFRIDDRWSTLLSDGLAYKSSDPRIAEVDDHGVVTAKKKGTVKITVKHLYLWKYHSYVSGKYTVKVTVK